MNQDMGVTHLYFILILRVICRNDPYSLEGKMIILLKLTNQTIVC